MKGHKLVTDAHDHFVLQHADGSHFKVAKNGLSAPMVGHIAKLPKVEHHFEGTLEASEPDETGTDMMGGESPAALQAKMRIASNPGTPVDVPQDAPLSVATPEPPLPGADASADQVPMASAENAEPTTVAPAAAAPAPAGPDASSQYLNDATAAMSAAKGANNDKAAAEGQVADDTADAVQNNLDQQAAKDAVYTTEHQKLDAHAEDLYKQVSEGKIDPHHMWSSASTSSKIGMIAGLLLSGMGSGLTGQPNMAMGVINKAIDADIDAQKANLSKNQGLLHYNLQKTRDLETAHSQTRLDLLSTMKGQIALAAAKQGSTVAQANAQSLNAGIDLQMAGLKQQVAQSKAMQALAGGMNQGGGETAGDLSPDRLKTALVLGQQGHPAGIPKEAQASARKEFGAYQRQKSVTSTLDKNFSIMENNHGLGIGSGALASDAKKAWDAAANIVSMTVDHELAGRVTETTLDELKANNMPKWGDSPTRVAEKKAIIADAIKEANAKEAEGYGTLITYGLLSPNNPHISSSSDVKKQGRSR